MRALRQDTAYIGPRDPLPVPPSEIEELLGLRPLRFLPNLASAMEIVDTLFGADVPLELRRRVKDGLVVWTCYIGGDTGIHWSAGEIGMTDYIAVLRCVLTILIAREDKKIMETLSGA